MEVFIEEEVSRDLYVDIDEEELVMVSTYYYFCECLCLGQEIGLF